MEGEGERDTERGWSERERKRGERRIEIHGGWCARRVARATTNVGVLERGGRGRERERERMVGERAVGEKRWGVGTP